MNLLAVCHWCSVKASLINLFASQNVTLEGFTGRFEILVLDAETSAVQSVAAETCSFTASEFICKNGRRCNCYRFLDAHGAKTYVSAVCSTDGMMTFVVDLSAMVLGGGEGAPGRTNLLDRSCRPDDSDDSRALFSFPINRCGSQAKVVCITFFF